MNTLAPSCTLSDLPIELLVEIVSHYPSSFTFLSPLVRQEHVAKEKERRQILRSLSQSRSVLRRICLPFLWERFEASKSNLQAIHTQSELATLILPCIKSVHISMSTWSPAEMETIFLFVEFLRALPNLTGLQIYHGFAWNVGPIVPYAFSNVSLPNVTALSVPDVLDGILPSFPNLKTISGPALKPRSRLLVAARQLPHLEALSGLHTRHLGQDARQSFISDLAHDFPHLRALSVSKPFPLDQEDLASLCAFKELRELDLLYKNESDSLSLDALIAGGLSVLRASRSPDAKVLRKCCENRAFKLLFNPKIRSVVTEMS
ncbi:hypothetical protein K438DRAFT_1976306 [Mycena galopus ATCC 62051]|nr:hypothetical protein K438DRAFT_1976306 [Mycena galopus ATCC 62051]